MKRIACFFISLSFFANLLAQNITPDDLIMREFGGEITFRLKSTKCKYSGMVQGYTSHRGNALGGYEFVLSRLYAYAYEHYEDTAIKSVLTTPLYMEGYLDNGKEIGIWHLSQPGNDILAIISFSSSANTFNIELYIRGNIIYQEESISNYYRTSKGRKKRIPPLTSQVTHN